MNQDEKEQSQVAVLGPEVEREEQQGVEENRSDRKPKKLPPYAVVVLNDDLHTFPYVIETFQRVFKYDIPKCYLLALQIHNDGRAIVWSGPKEVAELKRDQIRGAGPDFYAIKKVEFPLGVYIEPLPA